MEKFIGFVLAFAICLCPESCFANGANGIVRLGVVQVTAKEATITLPERYSGQKIEGVVELYNDASSALKISSIKTSCGCTKVAMNGEKLLHPQQSTQLRVSISVGEPGGYGATVTLLDNDRKIVRVTFRGTSRALIKLLSDSVHVSDDTLVGAFEVHSPQLDASQIRLSDQINVSRNGQVIKFSRKLSDEQKYVVLEPSIGGKKIDTIVIPVPRPCVMKLARPQVFVTGQSFFLFVLNVSKKPKTLRMEIKGKVVNAKISERLLSNTLLLKITLDDSSVGSDAQLIVDDVSLPFKLLSI